MTKNVKISLALVLAALAVLAVVAIFGRGDDDPPTARDREGDEAGTGAGASADALAPADSIRLAEAPDGAPVLIEFLDFECEGCRAAKPLVDDIRQRYDGEIEVVVRYMPLHASSVNAARAAEAANAQGRFVEMYDLLFETQPEWGEQQTAEEQYFFDLATQLDLDMDEFRAVYDDPDTLAKIERDQAEGQAAGVTGTPTFFLDGEQLDITTADDLISRIDDAVGR